MPKPLRLLFYIEQDYSFAILRPLQTAALAEGHEVRWLLLEDASSELLRPGEQTVSDAAAAVDYHPDAVFAPGDRAPAFIPGLKVQVFHGINEDKRGTTIPERGLFDLYCTQGAAQTAMLKPFERRRRYFRVAETGWLKLDALLNYDPPEKSYDRPQILYASTFTPSLSSAEALFPEIGKLSQAEKWQWLVTLHPKMSKQTVERYKSLANNNLAYFGADNVIELMHRADLMVSDNSSVLQEFLLLKKPVVTFRNRDPQACMINITEPEQLEGAVAEALDPGPQLREAIDAYGPSITEYLDGRSASRILTAVKDMLRDNWQDRKPLNLWRNLKMRRQLNYYKFF